MTDKELTRLFNWFESWFKDQGAGPYWAELLGFIVNLILVLLATYILDRILRVIIVWLFKRFSKSTKITYDDFLVKSNFPRYVSHYGPVLLFWYLEPFLFKGYDFLSDIVLKLVDIYMVVLTVLVVRSSLRSTMWYLRTKDQYKDKPLESYLQVLMIFAWAIGIILGISILTGYELKSLVTLGAASAAAMLIFRDTILGFVASIQITVNDIVRIGDWISMPKYGADGEVSEINLATVIVRNWDMTFTTVPTYSLISDSCQNWRGMQESGGRRIKRALMIKQSTVRFLNSEDLTRLGKVQLIGDLIKHRQDTIDKHNLRVNADKDLSLNGRNQTNLGLFRAYIDRYLQNTSGINKEMTLMVRPLAPTAEGVPIEIYCFSSDKVWKNYEYIMADIMDHVLASVSYFDLEIFELPSGSDFETLQTLNN